MEIINEQLNTSLPKSTKTPPQATGPTYQVNYELEHPFVECYTDGATVGHNGKLGTVSKVGLGVYCQEEQIYYSALAKGISNNEAEFMALIQGMNILLERDIKNVQFYLDSKIVVTRAMRSFIKKQKPKYVNERMDNFQRQVLDLAQKFNSIHFKWVPRTDNVVADELSKQATAGVSNN